MKPPKLLLLTSVILSLAACKKDDNMIRLTTNINVVNAAVDITPGIKVNMTGNPSFSYAAAPSLNYGTSAFYYVPRASVPVKIVASADTNTYFFNKSVDLQSGIYTMYLVGQAPNIDTMFRAETDFPFIRTDVINTSADSVVNVRFANLSPNSGPVKIKISTASTNVVDYLSLRDVSSFKPYPALLSSTSYIFQVRDAGTDALLLTYTFTANSTNRFKNVMLVIKGLRGNPPVTGTNALGVFAVNYF